MLMLCGWNENTRPNYKYWWRRLATTTKPMLWHEKTMRLVQQVFALNCIVIISIATATATKNHKLFSFTTAKSKYSTRMNTHKWMKNIFGISVGKPKSSKPPRGNITPLDADKFVLQTKPYRTHFIRPPTPHLRFNWDEKKSVHFTDTYSHFSQFFVEW